MFCNQCGKELPNGSEFCTNCGTRQDVTVHIAPTSPGAQHQNTYYSQSAPQAAQMQPSGQYAYTAPPYGGGLAPKKSGVLKTVLISLAGLSVVLVTVLIVVLMKNPVNKSVVTDILQASPYVDMDELSGGEFSLSNVAQ